MCFFLLLCFLCFYCYYVFIDVRLSHLNKDYLLTYYYYYIWVGLLVQIMF